MNRVLQRLCDSVDTVAGVLLGLVTLLVVASTIARYAFAVAIPDAFDVSRYLIGACLMWGFASIGYRGGHIAVDVIFEMLSKRGRTVLNVIAWAFLLIFTMLMAYMMYFRLASAYASNETTFDLRLPAWPFITLIWLGCVASVFMIIMNWIKPPSDDDQLHEGQGL